MAEMTIKKRPKNLDLKTIRLPLPGKVSILHRVSGAGLFLCLPVLLWLFSASLSSPETFETFRAVVSSLPAKVVLAGLIWAYCHHFCAGIRFLLLDLNKGVEIHRARASSYVCIVLGILTALVFAWRIW